jgi:hypothetical protein
MRKPPLNPQLAKHRQLVLDEILSGRLPYGDIVHRALAFGLVEEVCGIFDWNVEDFYKQLQPKTSDCRGCKRNRGTN